LDDKFIVFGLFALRPLDLTGLNCFILMASLDEQVALAIQHEELSQAANDSVGISGVDIPKRPRGDSSEDADVETVSIEAVPAGAPGSKRMRQAAFGQLSQSQIIRCVATVTAPPGLTLFEAVPEQLLPPNPVANLCDP